MTKPATIIKPFLRWAGGKQWISARLANLIPEDTRTYYEPFLGGASLYLAALPSNAVLSDVNPRLIETYQALRDSPQDVIDALRDWPNDKETYYSVRAMVLSDTVRRAAQFIYLNRTCWNGLYRVNRQGHFNVPFGNHHRAVFTVKHLFDVAAALKDADVRCGDFAKIVSGAGQRDFIYFDPPYTSVHANNGFKQYNKRIFSWRDHQRLGSTAVALAKEGCRVLVSNANDDSIRQLYPDFSSQVISRHSILAASPQYRRLTTELLLASHPGLLPALDARHSAKS